MKNFLFNTVVGVIFTMIIIAIFSLLLSTTITLLIWGGGIMIFNDIYANDVINVMILRTTTTLWTLINIVLFILVTIWLFIELMTITNDKYNMSGKMQEKADNKVYGSGRNSDI